MLQGAEGSKKKPRDARGRGLGSVTGSGVGAATRLMAHAVLAGSQRQASALPGCRGGPPLRTGACPSSLVWEDLRTAPVSGLQTPAHRLGPSRGRARRAASHAAAPAWAVSARGATEGTGWRVRPGRAPADGGQAGGSHAHKGTAAARQVVPVPGCFSPGSGPGRCGMYFVMGQTDGRRWG